MNDTLAVVASRVAKLLVTGVCAWALVHYKLDAPDWLRQSFEEVIAFGIASGAIGLAAHFGIALKANPMDTVSPTEARRGRLQKKARKTMRATEERIAKAAEVPYPTPEDSREEPPQLPPPQDRRWFGPQSDPHNHD
jgi:hypothetical protein